MCGFMVVTKQMEEALFQESFRKLKHRGPDATKLVCCKSGLLGFHRLAVMGIEDSGMQPMKRSGSYCVCNGEIYNYKALKEQVKDRYTFYSGSDCEVLLPMYECYQEGMFEQLDGEFAMVLYLEQEDTFLAARDPLGIRPMFYGYLIEGGEIAFASEAKALVKLCEEVFPFPIGTYYKNGTFHTYADITKPNKVQETQTEDICEHLHTLLEEAVCKRLSSDIPLGFLLSGGLDSSIVCAIGAKHTKKPIKTFAIGMKADAIDLAYAREAAAYLHSDHTEFYMEPLEVITLLNEVIWHLESYDITTIRASIGMYALCKNIRKHSDVRVLLSGEVSDELFGYKYTDYAPSAKAFQEESEKRVKELYEYDVLRADRCIAAHGMEARVPFSDYAFANYVLSIDPTYKQNKNGIGKYLLRKAFEKDLPKDLCYREKAAFSDAVGHSMVEFLKAYAQSCYSDEDLAQAQQHYQHVPPISKEALLYREIFETCYPGRGSFLTSYWMPNTSWPHCDVQDPSARVLPNYGTSGQ